MRISERGINFIKFYEQFVDHVYICPAGYPTIGYGHLVRKGETWGTITQEEGDALLGRDLTSYEAGVAQLLKGYILTQGQYDALVSFAFNVGLGALASSTLLRKIKRGDIIGASGEFQKWCYGGRPLKKISGLLKRRLRESAIFMEGIDVSN